MKYTASLLIIYYISTCAVIECQISDQQSCMDEKQEKCQSELDEKVNHLHSGLITPELCCPAIEARDCLRAALRECGFPKSSDTVLRPADCSTYDDGVTCENGSALVVAHAFPYNSEDHHNDEDSETIVEKKHGSADGNENSNELVEDTNHDSNNNNADDTSFTVAQQHMIDEHSAEDTIEGNKLEESEESAISESKAHANSDPSSNTNSNSGPPVATISTFSLFIAVFFLISQS